MRPYGLIQARTGDTGAKGASMMKMSASSLRPHTLDTGAKGASMMKMSASSLRPHTLDTGAKGASMMKMSGSQGNLLVHARVRHGGGGREEHVKTNSGSTGEPEHECRRDAKRQRSEDFAGESFFFLGRCISRRIVEPHERTSAGGILAKRQRSWSIKISFPMHEFFCDFFFTTGMRP